MGESPVFPIRDSRMNDPVRKRLVADRNLVAALMSIAPGAGHLYKHHYLSGLGFLIGGNLLVVLVSVMMALGTFGLSMIIIPVVYTLAVAVAAYYLPDWHGHHGYLHPWRPPEPKGDDEDVAD